MTDNREKIRFWINGEALFTELGTTVSSLLKKSHGVEMPCGGRHACGKCMVYAEGSFAAPSETEQKLLGAERLAQGIRLACFLEAVIHIGGQHEIILILHQCKQPVVEIRGRIHIAVHVDVPAPVGPIFFQRIIMIKASGIHVGKMIVCGKIRKIPVKPFPAVGKSCCRRQPRSGADYNRIRLPYFFFYRC